MKKNLIEILANVAEDILEHVAFIFVDDSGEDCKPQISTWSAIGAKVSFSGAENGCIHLWFSPDLAKEIATNMIGQDTEIDAKKCQDATKEMCNIITGHFITSAFENSDIVLGIPELLPENTLANDFENPSATWFSSEEERILVLAK